MRPLTQGGLLGAPYLSLPEKLDPLDFKNYLFAVSQYSVYLNHMWYIDSYLFNTLNITSFLGSICRG